MKKLFVHNPLFRLLSPVFSGIVVYLLILMVNNNIQQIQEQFLGQELYVCIALSYIIQEFSRGLLLIFKKFPLFKNQLLSIFIEIISAVLGCIIIVSFSITIYYKKIIGFSPNAEELWMFNSFFSIITLIYVLLFVSHQYLYKINTEKLSQELLIKQHIQDDFNNFKAGINPNLLFESFETLLVLIKQNKEEADDFIDCLATIYRYILSSKQKQLVPITEEVLHTKQLIELFNKLPYRNIILRVNLKSDFLVVPRTLLFLVEQIVRSTIISSEIELTIQLNESNNFFEVAYKHNDKITAPFSIKNLTEIKRIYTIYSNNSIKITEDENKRMILFPKLTLKKDLASLKVANLASLKVAN